jgi:hypothetical protein
MPAATRASISVPGSSGRSRQIAAAPRAARPRRRILTLVGVLREKLARTADVAAGHPAGLDDGVGVTLALGWLDGTPAPGLQR